MPSVFALNECRIKDSFRVQQISGMFDLEVPRVAKNSFNVELPALGDEWKIGAIVGPSGSGKTSIARSAFSEYYCDNMSWPTDVAVIDALTMVDSEKSYSIEELIEVLTAVGLSSPPNWIRSYYSQSNGEQFRCNLARALLQRQALTVMDEFTSVVDRTVAQLGSAAVSKAVRRKHWNTRFVAVTCHYDILPWLEPDWVLDMATGQLSRGRLRRPPIEITIHAAARDAWPLFRAYHYLSGNLHRGAKCYLACWKKYPIGFVAVLQNPGFRGMKRVHRLVVLPAFQGLGIGTRVLETVGDFYRKEGQRFSITSSHPALVFSLRKSNRWRTINRQRPGQSRGKFGSRSWRSTVSFEYFGPKKEYV